MRFSDKGPSGLLKWISGQVLPSVGAQAGPRRHLVSDICYLLRRFNKSSWGAILFPNQTFLQQEQTQTVHPSIPPFTCPGEGGAETEPKPLVSGSSELGEVSDKTELLTLDGVGPRTVLQTATTYGVFLPLSPPDSPEGRELLFHVTRSTGESLSLGDGGACRALR